MGSLTRLINTAAKLPVAVACDAVDTATGGTGKRARRVMLGHREAVAIEAVGECQECIEAGNNAAAIAALTRGGFPPAQALDIYLHFATNAR